MNNLKHRLTSLEQWGMRQARDFQPAGLRAAQETGFTGVLLNGGSGFGPDMLSPESLTTVAPLPDLMPRTARLNRAEAHRRIELLQAHGLSPWLLFWGVPGPDQSKAFFAAESNKLFDRRTRAEMHAAMHRRPELFGHRDPRTLSWRGSRPLCISHPDVQRFYDNLGAAIVDEFAELGGVVFFPGDNEPELCDTHCPRCRAGETSPWTMMAQHVNRIYRSFRQRAPQMPFYFVLWNHDPEASDGVVDSILDQLEPGIGIGMSLSDNVTQPRRGGMMTFSQPWSNMPEVGKQFAQIASMASAQGRAVMAMGELAQSEVWDPVCHNLPLPSKARAFLLNADNVSGVDAVMDFWGHRRPYMSHANLAMMRQVLNDSDVDVSEHLHAAAQRHYRITNAADGLTEQARTCWSQLEDVVDRWALLGWSQRFSFAIGRDGARGFLYSPLIPSVLRHIDDPWYLQPLAPRDEPDSGERFHSLQTEDRASFLCAGRAFGQFADALSEAGHETGAAIAREEANQIELAGELLTSISRFALAVRCFQTHRWDRLSEVVEQEVEGRDRQLQITGRLRDGAGVNPLLVAEDIANMNLFLSSDRCPDVPDEWFSLTAVPYTV